MHTRDTGSNPTAPAEALPASSDSRDTLEETVINPNRSLMAKRSLDLVASCVGLALLWPIFLAIAIAIKREDRGPVFFRQERVGQHGKPFRIWKFRTMVPDAERRGTLLTVAGDSRITRVGRYLRRTKLDELPQLINVLVGEMSLVGPRPEVPTFASKYTKKQQIVTHIKPGITDPASIEFIDEEDALPQHQDIETFYNDFIVPSKIEINIEYAGQATLFSDIKCIILTIVKLKKRP